MAKHTDWESEGAATSLSLLLSDLDPEWIADSGDLAGLGQAGELFARGAQSLPGDTPESALLKQAAEICDWLILAEGEAAMAGRALLVSALETLQAGASGSEAETLAAQLSSFAQEHGTGPLPAAAPAAPAAAAPAVDKVTVKEDEDLVIYQEFLAESAEHLEAVEIHVLDLERDPDNGELINSIFRPIHSIKGAAGFLGLSATNSLCHELETLLDRARKFTLRIDRQAIDVILAGVDLQKRLLANLRLLVDARAAHKPPPETARVEVGPLVELIHAFLQAPSPPAGMVDAEPDPSRLGGRLVAGGHISPEALARALAQQQRPLGRVLVDMGAVPGEVVEEAAAAQAQAGKPRHAASIKVDTSKLDSLMEIVGELVIAQSQVAQDERLRRTDAALLHQKIENQTKIITRIQEMTMAIRMVPLRQTFQKMHRLVRDTAQKTGKEVTLAVSGEDTEIDKTVIEEIADPLIHLLRNAVDHGIDPPEERVMRQKPPEGRVDLRAYHQGGNVVIEVADDGQGLDRRRILAKAVEKGLAAPDRQDFTDAEIHAFIMAAGFSTAAKATDISGRGVGMDVVRRNIEKLGGRIEIESREGEGTLFRIRLPLTMAVVDGMLVAVGAERYVIPTLSIEESLRPRPETITEVKGRGEVVQVRGRLIPILRLHELFELPDAPRPAWEGLVVVVSTGEQRVGLLTDALLGQQQVVIKNLGERLRGIRGVSGGCILGDGRVALILDVATLVAAAETRRAAMGA